MAEKVKTSESEEEVLRQKGYTLISKIGEGGYAKVYLGEFKASGQDKSIQLACKVINSLKAQKKYLTKFLPRELKILVKVNHPHIIQIHSIYQRKSKFFIFMRYAEKGDLLEYLLRSGAVTEGQARIWSRQIALAIQYLHTLEIAHRDIKCENILLTIHHNAKLSDFGFARFVLNEENRHELSETYCGSLSYAAPEVLNGEPYNPKIADMWSMGVLIYTMLNKAVPFPDTKNTKALYQNQLQKNWKFRARYVKTLSNEVKTLITALLEPDTYKRIKIENVINSNWIAMDPKLKALDMYEYAALSSALEEAKSLGVRQEGSRPSNQDHLAAAMKKLNVNRNSLNIFKEHDKGFDLQLIRSEFNKFEDRISV